MSQKRREFFHRRGFLPLRGGPMRPGLIQCGSQKRRPRCYGCDQVRAPPGTRGTMAPQGRILPPLYPSAAPLHCRIPSSGSDARAQVDFFLTGAGGSKPIAGEPADMATPQVEGYASDRPQPQAPGKSFLNIYSIKYHKRNLGSRRPSWRGGKDGRDRMRWIRWEERGRRER